MIVTSGVSLSRIVICALLSEAPTLVPSGFTYSKRPSTLPAGISILTWSVSSSSASVSSTIGTGITSSACQAAPSGMKSATANATTTETER